MHVRVYMPYHTAHMLDGQEIPGPLEPLANCILVKVKDAADVSAGGIVLPDQVRAGGGLCLCGVHACSGGRWKEGGYGANQAVFGVDVYCSLIWFIPCVIGEGEAHGGLGGGGGPRAAASRDGGADAHVCQDRYVPRV